MAKSPKQRGGRIPFAAGSPRFPAPGKTASASDLIPRAQPAIDLETFLAKRRPLVFGGRSNVPGSIVGAGAQGRALRQRRRTPRQ
jgi:hypothetical protein